jgi:hypothetical protein
MRLDHNQFGNFRHATEHDGSRSGPCEWRWTPSIDKKGKLSRYERPIPHHLGDTGLVGLGEVVPFRFDMISDLVLDIGTK